MTAIALKPTGPDDLIFLQALWNDGRVMQWVGFPEGVGVTAAAMAKWYAQYSDDVNFHHFIITSEEERRCGEVCFRLQDEYASLDIKLCPEAQGQGIATQALKAVIDAAFNSSQECQLVWTEPSVENQAAHRLYTRCGLVESSRPPEMEDGHPFWALDRKRWEEWRRATEGNKESETSGE